MRMWMVDPRFMCSRHLRGEYHELFAIVGILKKRRKIDGYIRNNLIEPLSLRSRYLLLKEEMLKRGFKPKASFDFSVDLLDYLPNSYKTFKIDRSSSLRILLDRCLVCKKNYLEI